MSAGGVQRRARLERYSDKSGQWRWRLVAANGRIVADSAEAYTRKRDLERAISAMVAAVASIVAAQVEGVAS